MTVTVQYVDRSRQHPTITLFNVATTLSAFSDCVYDWYEDANTVVVYVNGVTY